MEDAEIKNPGRLIPDRPEDAAFPEPDGQLLKKYEALKNLIRSFKSAAVAFSSGVDSTFLLQAALESGAEVIAVTAVSHSFPAREREEAAQFCGKKAVRQFFVEADELSVPGFRENTKDRCYVCKKDLFGRILALSEREGMAEVLEGSNLDDNGDYRPGLRAVAELGIRSPLREIGFTKREIRILSRHLGLPTAGKPSFACLASRFPYGEYISAEKLDMVDRGETILMGLGFRQFRVRIHGNLARIELQPEELTLIMREDVRAYVCREFKKIGFTYVSLDLQGYRTGSMNETLSEEELAAGKNN